MQRIYEVFATPLPGAPKVGTLFFPTHVVASARDEDRYDDDNFESNDYFNVRNEASLEKNASNRSKNAAKRISRTSRSRSAVKESLQTSLDERPIFLYDADWIENGFPIGNDLPLVKSPIRPLPGALTFSFLKERSISQEVLAFIREGLNKDELSEDDELSLRTLRRRSNGKNRVRFLDHGKEAEALDASSEDLGLTLPQDCMNGRASVTSAEWTGVLAPHAFRHAGGFDIVAGGLACGIRTKTASESTDLDTLIYAAHASENGRARRKEHLRLAADAVLPGRRTAFTVMHKKSECAVTLRRIDDPIDVPLWRGLALRLAEKAGIPVMASTLRTSLGTSVLLTERFDRTFDTETKLRTAPLLTLSAASLLPIMPAGSLRGARLSGTARASTRERTFAYLALADILNRTGAAPKRDLPLLWKRMTFAVLLQAESALSDWQFVREPMGWRLLPMHVLSLLPPDWSTSARATIDGRRSPTTPETCVAYARYFAMTIAEAKTALFEMRRAIADWESAALEMGAQPAEIDLMAPIFESN